MGRLALWRDLGPWGFLGVQAIFNVGCCGAGCDTGDRPARGVSGEKEITFEKVE